MFAPLWGRLFWFFRSKCCGNFFFEDLAHDFSVNGSPYTAMTIPISGPTEAIPFSLIKSARSAIIFLTIVSRSALDTDGAIFSRASLHALPEAMSRKISGIASFAAFPVSTAWSVSLNAWSEILLMSKPSLLSSVRVDSIVNAASLGLIPSLTELVKEREFLR